MRSKGTLKGLDDTVEMQCAGRRKEDVVGEEEEDSWRETEIRGNK